MQRRGAEALSLGAAQEGSGAVGGFCERSAASRGLARPRLNRSRSSALPSHSLHLGPHSPPHRRGSHCNGTQHVSLHPLPPPPPELPASSPFPSPFPAARCPVVVGKDAGGQGRLPPCAPHPTPQPPTLTHLADPPEDSLCDRLNTCRPPFPHPHSSPSPFLPALPAAQWWWARTPCAAPRWATWRG